MSAAPQMPPRWAEALLERLLAARDRQTVAGDLREEYAESIVLRRGRLLANMWYLRQVLSFLPRALAQGRPVKKTLLSLSFFTFACACWLTVTELALRHPGYLLRIGECLFIALISMATIVVRVANAKVCSERSLEAGAVALIGIGGQAFFRNARAVHFEGFVFLISLALLLQGVLTLLSSKGRRYGNPDFPRMPV